MCLVVIVTFRLPSCPHYLHFVVKSLPRCTTDRKRRSDPSLGLADPHVLAVTQFFMVNVRRCQQETAALRVSEETTV